MTLATWTNLLSAYRAYSLLAQIRDTDIPEERTLPEEGDLRLDGVSLQIGGVSLLEDIDFTLEQGRFLVIMGHNGAGKSTLAKVMAGLLAPTEGTVERRGSLGYAPQGATLFPGTAARTIARMSLSPDRNAVREAAGALGATWIEELPYGYDTPLDPARLSLGQLQQIVLARAWYGNPRLLILDEPDAHLDRYARECLVEGLIHAKELKTTIVVITHNPDIVTMADRVLVLQKGRMAAFGDRETILTQ